MKIRRAAKSDFTNYKRLRELSLIDYSKLAGEKLTIKEDLKKEFKILTGKDKIMLFAELEGKAIGYISANINREYKGSYINDIFIEKEYRRKGYAEKLFKELINQVKEKGTKKVRLDVRVNNAKAIKLYKKFGFETVHYGMDMKI